MVKKFVSSVPRWLIHIVASIEQILDLKTVGFEDVVDRFKHTKNEFEIMNTKITKAICCSTNQNTLTLGQIRVGVVGDMDGVVVDPIGTRFNVIVSQARPRMILTSRKVRVNTHLKYSAIGVTSLVTFLLNARIGKINKPKFLLSKPVIMIHNCLWSRQFMRQCS